MNIKYVGTRYLKEYSLHLKELPDNDRYTRFGFNANKTTIDSLILSMLYSPEMHHLFVALEGNAIIGFAHFAVDHGKTWELAVSVDAKHQGKGIGNKLMTSAIRWAKSNDIESMFMHCINENKKIQHLARKHKLKVVERSGSDITAEMSIPKQSRISSLHMRFMRFLKRTFNRT